jgi:hypothetical protein
LVEKWILPSRSETAEIGQKTEGILGVKGGERLLLRWNFCGEIKITCINSKKGGEAPFPLVIQFLIPCKAQTYFTYSDCNLILIDPHLLLNSGS